MDKKTMDKELDKLVEDSAFLRYHAEYVKRREFNTFDVLRYAEYEIRHSNVLAWLLDPGQTHGIGRAFLDWFLGKVNKSISDRGAQRVRVERELHYVDVTIFLESDEDRSIVAIENKTGRYSPEHPPQVSSDNQDENVATIKVRTRGRDATSGKTMALWGTRSKRMGDGGVSETGRGGGGRILRGVEVG